MFSPEKQKSYSLPLSDFHDFEANAIALSNKFPLYLYDETSEGVFMEKVEYSRMIGMDMPEKINTMTIMTWSILYV